MCDDHEGHVTAGYACDNPNVTSIGSYVSPVMHLSGGESTQTFDSRLDVTDPGIIMNGIIVPLFLENKKIRLILSAEDVAISVLGIIKFGGLKMHKELTCKKEKILHMFDPLPLPNKVCYPNQPSTHSQDTSAGYQMSCVSGALPLEEKTTTMLSTTTTTTTTLPIATKIGASIIF